MRFSISEEDQLGYSVYFILIHCVELAFTSHEIQKEKKLILFESSCYLVAIT